MAPQVIKFFGTKGPYGCFSNFAAHAFFDSKGVKYECSEQYFMKKKQELFDPHNNDIAKAIMCANNPKLIKKLGRKVKNFDAEVWDNNKYEVMMSALLLKFSQNSNICQMLLDTNDAYIEEASPFDYVWGTGQNGKGCNLLGQALMETREILKSMTLPRNS